jgi:hypothetical protein
MQHEENEKALIKERKKSGERNGADAEDCRFCHKNNQIDPGLRRVTTADV